MMQRFRILPLLILVAVAMVTLKLGTIWQDIAGLNASVKARSAAAEEKPPAAAPDAAPATAGGQAADPAAAAASGKVPGETASAGREAPAMPPMTAPASDDSFDPRDLSQSEIRLLQALADRRKALDAREYGINQREALLKAAEQRIMDKQAEFVSIRAEVKGLLGQLDEQEDKRIKDLVKLYENMKPKDAARILNDLELSVLMSVAQRMNVRRLAPVLAAMDSDKARAVTRALAKLEKGGKIDAARMKDSIAERK